MKRVQVAAPQNPNVAPKGSLSSRLPDAKVRMESPTGRWSLQGIRGAGRGYSSDPMMERMICRVAWGLLLLGTAAGLWEHWWP
jgi:hypothetical protein